MPDPDSRPFPTVIEFQPRAVIAFADYLARREEFNLRTRLSHYAHELSLVAQEAKPEGIRALLREMDEIAGRL